MTKHYTKAFSPQEKQAAIAKYADLIKYSARYSDDQYEYRFVVGNAKSPKLQPYSPSSALIHLPLLPRLLLCNRHVCLPKALVKYLPAGIASEDEWRGIGVRQSPGWEMYMRHEPEPHVLLFKRDKDYDQKHPPLTERRTQPQARQRQAPAQNLS